MGKIGDRGVGKSYIGIRDVNVSWDGELFIDRIGTGSDISAVVFLSLIFAAFDRE